MANLNTKGDALLSSTTVDMKTAASTTLYTVPTGRVLRITKIVVRDPTASLAGGTSYSITNWVQTFDLSGITTTSTGYGVLYAETSSAKKPSLYTEIAAGTAVQITVNTGSTAVASATIDLFGYLT